MYDTIIKGGVVVDGTGSPAINADVAIVDGRIAKIGRVSSAARQTIDADGALVTPGFLDIHTHYDGQFLWDDKLDPSFSHGVTTAIAGNCGVGFAPVEPEHRRELIELMEGVEDIPDVVLDEGLDWRWRSFPDYLNRLAAREFTMDVASHITHAPLRVFVMGERALRHEMATPEDVATMSVLVREAMAAGAMGFSAARILEHRSSTGAHVPGTFAPQDELLAMARAMSSSGHGVFQIIPIGAIGAVIQEEAGSDARLAEHRLFEAIAELTGRPLTYSLNQFPSDPGDFPRMLEASRAAVARGLDINPQIAPRGVGLVNLLDGYHVFLMRPSYREIAHLPLAERVKAMREPQRRLAILSEDDVAGEYAATPNILGMLRRMQVNLAQSYVLETLVDYEPGPERQVGALAQGKTPEAYIYDHYAEGVGKNFNLSFPLNYVHRSLDYVRDLYESPNVVSGLGDGGAHVKIVTDSALPTFQIAFWTRDRKRGERVALETVVNKLTGAPARLYGLADRGVLAVGRRADINVIDHQRLTLTAPHMAYDLPSGGARLLQGSEGYLATMVAGVATRRDDEDTGARPGRLVRGSAS